MPKPDIQGCRYYVVHPVNIGRVWARSPQAPKLVGAIGGHGINEASGREQPLYMHFHSILLLLYYLRPLYYIRYKDENFTKMHRYVQKSIRDTFMT